MSPLLLLLPVLFGAEGDRPRAEFPHIRVDVEGRTVEFDGVVPIRLDDPRAPRVYLEQVVCVPDTKEHESLIVTNARPSHVHAALLAIGLEPGRPAQWRAEGTRMVCDPPAGPAVRVELIYLNSVGERIIDQPWRWVKNARTGEPWPRGDWVFAGSIMRTRQGREVYDADASGTLIGLASFGTEVLAWPDTFSPDSQVHEPEWIADAERVPPMNTQVTVRLTAAQ